MQQVTTQHKQHVTMYFNATLHTNPSSHCLLKSTLNETQNVTFNITIRGKYTATYGVTPLPHLDQMI
jgi:hypothetical protein